MSDTPETVIRHLRAAIISAEGITAERVTFADVDEARRLLKQLEETILRRWLYHATINGQRP
jgi:hypothetical protein